jgi:hypothetical protein
VDNAVAEGLGGRRKKAFRFRQDVLPRLPTELRVVVGCAEIIAPEVTSYDFIEIHPDEAKVKGIRCDDAGKAIPAIINIIEIDLRALRMRSSSPMQAMLYLKSRYLPLHDPTRSAQEEVDLKLVRAGIVSEEGDGPLAADLIRLIRSKR